ncbi:DNA-binding protein [Mycobacterium marinum M]|uniref:DNA-binding protein n=1 Tax=Mycobacterium marinum (strain ATCC BAA-535 / M) TaxID=216594 RepID=B2HI81_MYCMM|nr:cold shock domain-containing protein [Mycobacterium marinum]ACC38507.1 DNA-binding protein [Mycobacterium marinum M]RFZ64571.1 Cold shock-like protein CspD [Mycobacterium marinum]
MRGTGRIVRFDDVRGYGFIAPDSGGEDVFLHANDLDFDRLLAKRGTRVSFDIEDGPRGKFATAVLITSEGSGRAGAGSKAAASDTDEYFDVFSAQEFKEAATEILLEATPSITGEQIVRIRAAFEGFARKHGWIE